MITAAFQISLVSTVVIVGAGMFYESFLAPRLRISRLAGRQDIDNISDELCWECEQRYARTDLGPWCSEACKGAWN